MINMAGGGEKRREYKRHSFHEGNMAGTIFVRIAGDVQGPYDAAKVKQLAVAGRLRRDDELSQDRQKWTQARNVKGLVFAATSTSPDKRTPANRANGTIETSGANGITQYPAPKADSKVTQTAHRPASAHASRLYGGAPAVDVLATPGLRSGTARLPLNLADCPDCGHFVSLRASDCPHCGGPIRRSPPPQPKQRYRLLRLIGSMYAALGILTTLLAAFLAVVLIYFITQNDVSGATAAFLALVVCITAGITCIAVSEGIQVFLQIEQNTRATRLAATHRSLAELGG
jgi:rRNA maturation protein Nop10